MCANSKTDKFDVVRFLGRGKYSVVYEVESTQGHDAGRLYALKRTFLSTACVALSVMKEHHTLMRLTRSLHPSPFLPILYYSFPLYQSAVLAITRGSGITLCDLNKYMGQLSEEIAQFYTAEIVCALQYLHNMSIVHMDLKVNNVLLSETGHILLTDFDCSYDLTYCDQPPTVCDFRGTRHVLAPEIAERRELSTKADVWSLGILVAELVCGPMRPPPSRRRFELRPKRGIQLIKDFETLSEPMQEFFKACLELDAHQRPTIEEVKYLSYFDDIDWDDICKGRQIPPLCISDFYNPKPPSDPLAPPKLVTSYFSVPEYELFKDHYNPIILRSAFWENILPIKDHVPFAVASEDPKLLLILFEKHKLSGVSELTAEELEEFGRRIDFTHPVTCARGDVLRIIREDENEKKSRTE